MMQTLFHVLSVWHVNILIGKGQEFKYNNSFLITYLYIVKVDIYV